MSTDPPHPTDVAPDAPRDLADLCVELLTRDAAKRPTGADVVDRLSPALGGGGAARGARLRRVDGGPEPFVGRDAPLGALREAWEETKRGGTVTVRVRGASGLGKTTLIRRFLDEVGRGRAVVLEGRCYEHESLPYKAVDELVDQLAQYLHASAIVEGKRIELPADVRLVAELFPVLDRVTAVREAPSPGVIPDLHERRRRAFAALRALFATIAAETPLVLFVDDLQWGDPDGAAFFAELSAARVPSLLLVVAQREGEAATGRGEGVRDIALAPLSYDEARSLASTLLGAPAARSADTIAGEAGGIPLFVRELAGWVHEGGSLGGGAAMGGSEAAPPRFDELVVRRVSQLTEETVRLLDVVAVAGHPLSSTLAASAARLAGPPHRLIERLRSARLVVTREGEGGAVIEPSHDRIRQAIVRRLADGERRARHAALAGAMEALPNPDAVLLFEQLRGAGELDRASVWAVRAADAAARALAFERAAQLYGQALAMGGGGVDRWELLARRGDALANAGRGGEAGSVYALASSARASIDAKSPDVDRLVRRAAEQYMRAGYLDEGMALLKQVLARVGISFPESTGRALASLLARRAKLALRGLSFEQASDVVPSLLERMDACWAAVVGLSLVDPLRSAGFHTMYALMALRAGERDRVVRALGVEAAYLASIGGRGRWEKAAKLCDVFLDLASRSDDPYVPAYASFAAGTSAFFSGSWDRALELSERAAKKFRDECAGAAWETASSLLFTHASLAYLGRLDELAARVPLELRDADERGDVYAATTLRLGMSNLAMLARGRVHEARRLAEEGLARWVKDGFHAQHYLHVLAAAHIALYEGRPGDGLLRVVEAWPSMARNHFLRLAYVRVEFHHLRARCALASAASDETIEGWSRADLIRLAGRDARAIEKETFGPARPLATAIRAGLAQLAGDAARARELLGEAVPSFEKRSMLLHARCARASLGESVDMPGVTDQAAMRRVFMPGVAI